jgi:hypothetical protein
VVLPNQLYFPNKNAIYDAMSGAGIWTGSVSAIKAGAALEKFVVYVDRYRVLVEPR